MDFDVSIGESHIFRLQKAVLLYGQNPHTCSFATVHDVRFQDNEETPSLGEAQLLRADFLRELVKGLSSNCPTEILPEHVLVRNELVTAWWRPAQQRTMFFHPDTPLAPVDGKKFPIPPLVFRVVSGCLAVRALVESARPQADTPLSIAPFWNVFEDGRVCHGSMRAPDDTSLNALDLWENAFFGSNFTHTIRDSICLHPGGSEALWKDLAGNSGLFPVIDLKRANQTLQEFISRAS
jgi:PRTRC genetic system protein B